MVLEKLWVSQNFSRISRVSQSRFLVVMCVSQSRFLYESVSKSRFFCKAKGLEVPIRLFLGSYEDDTSDLFLTQAINLSRLG